MNVGDSVKVSEVRIEGDQAARRQLKALKPTRILPGIPGLWNRWRLMPAYGRDAVDSDSGRILSSYLLKGYLDAESPSIPSSRITTRAFPSSSIPASNILCQGLCTSLLAQRREAQKKGVLDFTVHFDFEHQRHGQRAPVSRRPHQFVGNRRFSIPPCADFLLDEGDISMSRCSARRRASQQHQRFDPVDERTSSCSRCPKPASPT